MVRWEALMPPQPMIALVIWPEGGVWPLSPSTRLGTICTVASAAKDLRRWRRVVIMVLAGAGPYGGGGEMFSAIRE